MTMRTGQSRVVSSIREDGGRVRTVLLCHHALHHTDLHYISVSHPVSTHLSALKLNYGAEVRPDWLTDEFYISYLGQDV